MEKTMDTLRVAAGVEKRLNKYMALQLGACGHESELIKADKARNRMFDYLERELEKLQGGGK